MRSTLPSLFVRSLPSFLFAAIAVAACGGSGDTEDDGVPGAGGAAGSAGSVAKGGSAGSGATAGTGGASGAAGKAGNAGTGGAAGKAGAAGSAGKAGAAGASGSAGKAGSAGTAGASGSAGSAGKAGSAGAAGASGSAGSAGGPTCKTCKDLGANCGPTNDGCGNVLQCGSCAPDETCGAVTPNVCSKASCTPKTCGDLGLNCGPAGDGCGAALDCGACTNAGESCGGGGVSGVCGSSQMCVPKDCASQGISCGPAGDGCGAALDCGQCPQGQSCGGGGTPGVCGAPACTPKTCADLGLACGPAADGCGGLLQCGTCSLPETCGGQTPGTCGTPVTCTNLCLQQVTCPGGATTTITGTVYAPNGTDPLPNAAVYVPNGTVQPFPAGVSCDTCGAAASGSPLVSAVTAVDGKFTLKNVPVGTNIPLVIQIGRWRRQITVSTVTACQDNPLTAAQTRLPKNKNEGDIPLMAFATGQVDALECVFRKIGIDDSEFTSSTGNGRIRLYTGSGSKGAGVSGGTQTQDTLTGSQAELDKYDIVLFPCQADQYNQTSARRQRVLTYLNKGGRVFATHFSYVWLFNTTPLSSTATWNVGQNDIQDDPQTGYIDMSFPKGAALAQWLQIVGASTTLGEIPIGVLRHDMDAVVAPGQLWMTINDPGAGVVPMHFTFNTPVASPADQQCGRVVYDDFHVEDVNNAGNFVFPNECKAGPMTPQEKLLEFMLFDLASCVTPDIPTCTPTSCTDQGLGCGPAGDGCGNVIDCGTCPAGQTCGGGGTPSQCGAPSCTPTSCASQGIQCGPAGDGCGNLLQCGTCPTGQTCGGGGKPGVCGTQGCTPKTCADFGFNCGPAGDGCGNLLQCGDCPPGQTCGGGGQPGVCGAPSCTPKSCADQGLDCGPAGDGCGNLLQCGDCLVPQTCGGGGTPGVCGGNGKPLGTLATGGGGYRQSRPIPRNTGRSSDCARRREVRRGARRTSRRFVRRSRQAAAGASVSARVALTGDTACGPSRVPLRSPEAPRRRPSARHARRRPSARTPASS